MELYNTQDKGLFSIICKELLEINNKKISRPVEIWGKDRNRESKENEKRQLNLKNG